jgi:hypothetical protein
MEMALPGDTYQRTQAGEPSGDHGGSSLGENDRSATHPRRKRSRNRPQGSTQELRVEVVKKEKMGEDGDKKK